MTTEDTVPTQNTTSSATHARWVRLCRIPLLFAFALVAYQAARLPLAARSTDPASDLLTNVSPHDDPHAGWAADNLPAATNDDGHQLDVFDAAILAAGNDGDSAEPPADFVPNDDGSAPVDADSAWEEKLALALNSGNQLVGDVVQTLAEGANHPVEDTDLFGSDVDDLLAADVTVDEDEPKVVDTPPIGTAAADTATVDTTAVDTSGADTTPAIELPETLVLVNPSEYELGYVVNNELYRLAPGERHEIGIEQTWVIKFHRGGEFGEANYELSAGTYEFRVGDSGWELAQ